MRHFVCMLLLLLVLEVVVEARRWRGKAHLCELMFVRPRIAFKQCTAACWKHKNCWGYCDLEHGRKQCICGDCERACFPAPTGQPATSPPAPTEQPATSPLVPNKQPQIIYFDVDAPHDASQIAVYVDHVKDQLQQMMKRLDIAYEGTFNVTAKDGSAGKLSITARMPKVECKKVPPMIKELFETFRMKRYWTMSCRS